LRDKWCYFTRNGCHHCECNNLLSNIWIPAFVGMTLSLSYWRLVSELVSVLVYVEHNLVSELIKIRVKSIKIIIIIIFSLDVYIPDSV